MQTRIGDLGQSHRLTSTLLEIQARNRADQQAVASGKAATSYAQIADQAGVLVRAKAASQLKSAMADRNDRLTARLQVTDGALDRLISITERAKSLLVQRLNGATGEAVPIAPETEVMLGEVANGLNMTFDGSYLFAGSVRDRPPVSLPATPITTADSSLYYRGDTVRPTAVIEEGAEVEHGLLASDAPFTQLIAALGLANSSDAAGDEAGLQAALHQIDLALDGLIDLRSGLAVKSAYVDSASESLRATVDYLDETVSNIEDTDLPAVMTRLSRDQANIEASYLVISQLNKISLTDYIK